jgi:hypothetical protein
MGTAPESGVRLGVTLNLLWSLSVKIITFATLAVELEATALTSLVCFACLGRSSSSFFGHGLASETQTLAS